MVPVVSQLLLGPPIRSEAAGADRCSQFLLFGHPLSTTKVNIVDLVASCWIVAVLKNSLAFLGQRKVFSVVPRALNWTRLVSSLGQSLTAREAVQEDSRG